MRFGNPSKRMRRKLYGYLKNTPLKKDTKKEEEYNPLKITAISIISFSNATTRHYLAEKLFQSCGYCMRTPNSNSTFIIGAPANKKGEMYDMALDYLSK